MESIKTLLRILAIVVLTFIMFRMTEFSDKLNDDHNQNVSEQHTEQVKEGVIQ